MLKIKLNLRNVVAMTICLAGMTMFSGCEKMDYNKLESTKWVAETDNAIFTLNFEKSVCYFGTGGKGDILLANLTTYNWKYRSDMDSWWGLFQMVEEGGGRTYSGTVENKKLYLHIYKEDIEDIEILCFKRLK